MLTIWKVSLISLSLVHRMELSDSGMPMITQSKQDVLIKSVTLQEFTLLSLYSQTRLFSQAGPMESLELSELTITNNYGRSIMLTKMV